MFLYVIYDQTEDVYRFNELSMGAASKFKKLNRTFL